MNTKLAGKSDTSHSHSTHLTTEIAAGADLNTVTTAGWYKCSARATAAGLKNCPTKIAFAMEVLLNAGVTQKVYEYDSSVPKVYIRNFHDSAWGEWKRIYTTADKPTLSELGAAAASHSHTKSQITDFAHTHDDRYYTESEIDTKLSGKAASSHKHAAADITSVNASAITGTIAAANLPSYVDDVLEYAGTSKFPSTGEAGKIYTDTTTNTIYRWGGSSYVVISDTKVQAHIANTTIHITAAERAKWNAKADITIGTAEPTSSTSGIFYIQTN